MTWFQWLEPLADTRWGRLALLLGRAWLGMMRADTLGPLAIAAIFLVAAWGYGRCLCTYLFKINAPHAVALVLGLGAWGVVTAWGGQWGLWPKACAWIAVGGGLLCALWFLRTYRPRKLNTTSLRDLALMALVALVALPAVAHPTVAYDAMVYHLALPQYYAATQSTAPVAWNVYSFMPSLGHMLYLNAFLLGDIICAQYVAVVTLFLSGWVMRDVTRHFFGDGAGTIALLVVLTTPILFVGAVTIGVDTWLFCLCAVAVWVSTHVVHRSSPGVWGMLTFTLALSLGTKYSAVLSVLLPTVVLLVLTKDAWQFRGRWLAFAPAFIALIIWPLRNVLAGKAPLYPMAWLSWLGPGMEPHRYEALQIDAHATAAMKYSWGEILTAPVQMLVGEAARLEHAFGAGALIGTCILAGALLSHSDKLPRTSGIAGAVGFVITAWVFHMSRFAAPALAAVIPAAAGGFGRELQRRCWLGTVLWVLALTPGILMSARSAAAITHGFGMLVYGLTPQQYLHKRSQQLPHLQPTLAAAHLKGRTITLGASAALYLGPQVQAPTWMDRNPALEHLRRGESVAQTLNKTGAQSLLMQESGLAGPARLAGTTPEKLWNAAAGAGVVQIDVTPGIRVWALESPRAFLRFTDSPHNHPATAELVRALVPSPGHQISLPRFARRESIAVPRYPSRGFALSRCN